MSDLQVRKIADFATKVGSGSTPNGGEANYKIEGIPLIRSMNVHFDGFRYDGLAFLDNDQASALKNVEVRAGDVLLNITGASIGRVTVTPEKLQGARVNQHVCIIRPDESVNSSYLSWYLASPVVQRQINSMESGATRQALTKEKILGFEVPVPDLVTQREAVAEIEKQFSRLDEAVANLLRVKANLKRYKASFLKAAVEGRLVETKVKFDQSDDSSKWIPIGTVTESLDQGWSPQCENESRSSDQQWAVIKTTAVQHMQFLLDENKKLPSELTPREHLELVEGDLLITRAGPRSRVGVCCLVRSSANRLMLCDKAYRLRAKLEAVLPAYLEVVLNSPTLLDSLDEMKSGISDSGLNLTQKRFLELCIPLPPLDVQTNIVTEVDRQLSIICELEADVDANILRAQVLRQTILSKAFVSA